MTLRAPLFLCFLIGCAATDYGAPGASTTIDLQQDGGFGGPSNERGVRIVGTAVTYTASARTGQATLDSAAVAKIIDALEEIEFLSLDAEYTICSNAATDMPDVTIDVSLAAGSHHVTHYLGCTGGVFGELKTLDQKIYELSGFTAWAN